MKRRTFVRTSASAALAGVTPRLWSSHHRMAGARTAKFSEQSLAITLNDPRVRAMALSAVDAARTAGAQYAAVRATNTITRRVRGDTKAPPQTVQLGLSVRALVNGYWGWAATPTISADEAVRVARVATTFAKQGASHGPPRTSVFEPMPAVHGEWMTPVKVDPFTLDVRDVSLWLAGMSGDLADLGGARSAPPSSAWTHVNRDRNVSVASVEFGKQERLLSTTDGTLILQTVVTTTPQFSVPYRGQLLEIPQFNQTVQAGWERVTEPPLADWFRREMDRADTTPSTLPMKQLDIGRYDMVLSARAMAQVLNRTLAPATELDRILGYEATTSGTSYLGANPLTALGKAAASPLVTIRADRSAPLSLATAKWDDDGVSPEDFVLIKQGVLVDYPTTREHTALLAPYYQKQAQAVRSHGCAMAPSALEEPMQHTPNLTMEPGQNTADVESLVQDVEHGVMVDALKSVDVDWQCLGVYCVSFDATEIRHGKRASRLPSESHNAIIFRADEFWKHIQTLGGRGSAEHYAVGSAKGKPVQTTEYSITAVPARITQLAVIDPTRRG